ncbi:MAG TPA: formate/nitrite family transporter [Anaerolineales bacterium]|nr:formate/nitrite family transporter [Anaerolineales bacterium]
MAPDINIDALLPAEMARRAELLGVRKSEMKLSNMLGLAVLAGAFIGLGAAFATTISAGTSGAWPYGVTRLLTGLVFCLGLILVIVGGAELFTGNNLIVMAWASRKVNTSALLRNWTIVYLGNFVGSIATALVIFFGKQYTFGGGAIGTSALAIANSKVHLDFIQAIALGIMCNAMVCLAVWMSYSARSVTDKILAIIFPISGFVAAGFEHSIANMYFIPIGLFIKQFDPAFAANSGLDLSGLTWGSFLVNNLLPVTIGNIIGGGGLVAIVYWYIFLREAPPK